MLRKLSTKNSTDQIWYCDDDWDLVVWINADQSPRGFQICYDRDDAEKALTFVNGEFSHELVDEGNDEPHTNHSPVLDGEIPFNAKNLLKLFETKADHVEKIYFDYIKTNLSKA